MIQRRLVLSLLATTALLGACAQLPGGGSTDHPPVVFVHGNGDSASIWQTTVWRFESTCPTRWRATTTRRHSPGAPPPPSTWPI